MFSGVNEVLYSVPGWASRAILRDRSPSFDLEREELKSQQSIRKTTISAGLTGSGCSAGGGGNLEPDDLTAGGLPGLIVAGHRHRATGLRAIAKKKRGGGRQTAAKKKRSKKRAAAAAGVVAVGQTTKTKKRRGAKKKKSTGGRRKKSGAVQKKRRATATGSKKRKGGRRKRKSSTAAAKYII